MSDRKIDLWFWIIIMFSLTVTFVSSVAIVYIEYTQVDDKTKPAEINTEQAVAAIDH